MNNNAAIVQAAVRKNGHALKYASDEMKNNAAIVQAAVYPPLIYCKQKKRDAAIRSG